MRVRSRHRTGRSPNPELGRPGDIDPTGVPGERSDREGLILAAGLLVAVLALVFTLGWVVFNQIVVDQDPPPQQTPTEGPLTGGEGDGGSAVGAR